MLDNAGNDFSGGDGGESNSPSRKVPFKASTCVAVGYVYRFRTMPTASVRGSGCREPLDVLPALHIRTSDFRRPINAAEDNTYRTSRLTKQQRGRLLVRQLCFCPF